MTHSLVEPAVDYASLSQRLAAQFLDGLVTLVPLLVAPLIALAFRPVNVVPMVMAIGIAILYYLLADGLEGGQSLGKRLVGIRVVSADTGRPCTFGQSLVRNFLLAVLGPIDWIFIFGERHQRLGDKAAHTLVVVD